MMSESEKIGQVIQVARKRKKITQAQLGKELGISKLTVSGYETGKIKIIPFERRLQLGAILDIDPEDIFYTNELSQLTGEDWERAWKSLDAIRNLSPESRRNSEDWEKAISEKAISIDRVITRKEVNCYSYYFGNLCNELALNQLIYIMFTVFLTVRRSLGVGMCIEILKAVLETRFRLYGMDGIQAQKDAKDIANDISLLFIDLYMESRKLDDVIIVDVTSKELQTKLEAALEHFKTVPGKIHHMVKHEIFPGDAGLPPMPANEKEK